MWRSLEGAWQLRLFVVMCKGLSWTASRHRARWCRSFPDVACGVLSGPTFAGEVAAETHGGFVGDRPQMDDPERYQEASNASLRAYLTRDVQGTELGGTLKNIYAIASGLCDGLKRVIMQSLRCSHAA